MQQQLNITNQRLGQFNMDNENLKVGPPLNPFFFSLLLTGTEPQSLHNGTHRRRRHDRKHLLPHFILPSDAH
jgi:hypothetical protein